MNVSSTMIPASKVNGNFLLSWYSTVCLLLSVLLCSVAHADLADERGRAAKLQKGGNWKEALEVYEKAFTEVSDAESSNDLKNAVHCLYKLADYSGLERFLKLLEEKHGENWQVLLEAGDMLKNANHNGVIIDNVYQRGTRWRQGAIHANSLERDRAIALKLYWKAYQKAPEGSKVNALAKFETYLFRQRFQHSFYSLTDLTILPEVEEGYNHHYGAGQGRVPVGEDGETLFIRMPESYEAARNDGERWRWVVSEIRRLGTGKNYGKADWADFMHSFYGVRTLNTFAWWRSYREPENQKGEKEAILVLDTLSDEETLCRAGTGVKRIKLKDEFNFVKIYRDLYENSSPTAGDQLVEIYLDRRQYKKAAELIADVIEKHGEGEKKIRRKKQNQIIGDWGSFVEGKSHFLKGEEMDVELKFRNAKAVKISLFEIDFKGVTDDLWNYWRSNPTQLDYDRRGFGYNFSDALLNGRYNGFIGDEIYTHKAELSPRAGHLDTLVNLSIPKQQKTGGYLLRGEVGEGDDTKVFYKLVWVDGIKVVSTGVHNGTLYYVTDAETGKPLAGAIIQMRGFYQEHLKQKDPSGRRHDIKTKELAYETNEQGCVIVSNKNRNYQWMLTAKHEENLAWMSNQYIRSGYYWNDLKRSGSAFGITSQPVYRPGSKLEGKAWLRETDYTKDEAVSVFANRSLQIDVTDATGKKLGESFNATADAYGGVNYAIDIPEDATLGTYYVRVGSYGAGTFRVEKYKKPEFEVSVNAPTEPVLLGENIEAIVRAKYYHGAPVTEAKVKVKILRHSHNARWFPSFRWDWLYGNGYGWLDIDRPWSPWMGRWNCKCPYPIWYQSYERPELVSEKILELQPDGTVKVKIDTSLAKLIHSDKDHRYEISAEVTDASRRTIFAKGSVIAARKPFQVTTWLNRGYASVGEEVTVNTTARTLSGKRVKGKGHFILTRVTLGDDGKFKEQEVKRWELKEDTETFEKLSFSCEKPGQYSIVSEVTDAKGRTEKGGVLFEVRGKEGKAAGVTYNHLELIIDKREYASNDVVKLLVNTKQKESHVLLFIRHTKEMKLVKIDDYSATVEIPLNRKDIPNIAVQALTISEGSIHRAIREIIIPPVEKTLNVEVLTDSEKYRPQDKGSVKVRVTDHLGEPVGGSAVVAIYDKSLEYISGGSNVGEIKPFFWKKRYLRRMHWVESILWLGGPVVKKNHPWMQSLGIFGSSLARDEDFKILEKGKKRDNGEFKSEIGKNIFRKDSRDRVGALFADESSVLAEISDNEGAASLSDIQVRKDFADLAKWVGTLELDENGEASIPVEFPDNLTTWKIKTWTMSHGTRVGEGSTEVITSKDLIIRLQAPRFFVEKDEVTLSAVVHNYHDTAQDAEVSIELEGDHLTLLTENKKSIQLKEKNGEERVDWTVKVSGEGEVVVRMKVLTAKDGDVMEMKFPVYVHGIQKQTAASGSAGVKENSIQFEIDVPEERKPELSRLEIRYSPSLAMAIVDALPYLVEYPHGCTEQTLNRFVPTVITQNLLKEMGVNLEDVKNKRTNLNAQELGDDKARAERWKTWKRNPVFDSDEVAKMTRQGVTKLTEMQLSDGGWGWFSGSGERSYPHTTAVVLHGLMLAKKNGADIPDQVIKRGLTWLQNYEKRQFNSILSYRKTKGKDGKNAPDHRDVLVRLTLAEKGIAHPAMLDEIYKVKNNQSVYVKCMLALCLHDAKEEKKFALVMQNIEQFLTEDEENQTAHLKLQNGNYWWYWYGNNIETQAIYLRLLTITEPSSKKTRGLVKYLLNNRSQGTYWNSTRDTAYCIEAIAGFIKASKEDQPDITLEVLIDGEVKKEVRVNKDNLFTYDNKFVLEGDQVSSGKHQIELRKKGNGALYANAYLSVFTKEDHIKKTGAEVKVERRYYKLVRKESTTKVTNAQGQIVKQQADRKERIRLKEGDTIKSGDTIEVELILESKNDYEYLMVSDWKAAGLEAEKVRSGYIWNSGFSAYMEVHDERISYFIKHLSKGKHSLTYKLRAEIPGKFSALPAQIEAMYAPELKANSDEMKIKVKE